MSNVIAPRTFAARIGSLKAAPDLTDSLVRYAIFHGYKDGQLTPSNQILSAIAESLGRGDLFAIVRDTLATEFKGFATLKGDVFVKIKGASIMDAVGAEARAMRPLSVADQLQAIRDKRAEARNKRTAAPATAAPATVEAAPATVEATPATAVPAVVSIDAALSVVLSALHAGSVAREDINVLWAALAAADNALMAHEAIKAAADPATAATAAPATDPATVEAAPATAAPATAATAAPATADPATA